MADGYRFSSITFDIASKLYPQEAFDTNKSERGRALILAGSADHLGAGILASRACARSGAGYTLLATSVSANEKIEHPDFIYVKNPEGEIKKSQAVLVGPGYGKSKKTSDIIRRLIKKKIEAVILDADALTVIAEEKIFPLPSTWILTPHEGELARLMGVSSEEIKSDRMHWAQRAQNKYRARIVLKGPRTLTVSHNRCYQNLSGNTALAKAGTGDVLAGIITAFRCQGLSPLRAATLAVFVHGLCAEIWVSDGNSALSLMASDLIELIPRALGQLQSHLNEE
jgi:yjeF C-terminal region, hydroxyethylthiazole kinase-related